MYAKKSAGTITTYNMWMIIGFRKIDKKDLANLKLFSFELGETETWIDWFLELFLYGSNNYKFAYHWRISLFQTFFYNVWVVQKSNGFCEINHTLVNFFQFKLL